MKLKTRPATRWISSSDDHEIHYLLGKDKERTKGGKETKELLFSDKISLPAVEVVKVD